MAKDPAFLFYPGDYLRDTQCLSEKVQVSYDRIMCEHMRNICISQEQLNFFTKRLNLEEKQELAMVLTKVEGGYQIDWVVESICKRRKYSKSRSDNRKGKKANISLSYDPHMEIENVNLYKVSICPEMVKIFKVSYPKYPANKDTDYPACLQIAYKIAETKEWAKDSVLNGRMGDVLNIWRFMVEFSATDDWFKTRAISDFNKEFQRLVQKITNKKEVKKEIPIKTEAPPLKKI